MPPGFMFTSRTLLEGKWALLVLAALAVASLVAHQRLGGFWWLLATGVTVALLAFTISFYRDPERPISPDPRDIVAPADGRVVEISQVNEPLYLKGPATRVAIFLSVFDVHVQRMPIAGEIKFVQYTAGKFLDVRDAQASALNESRYIGIEDANGYRVVVRQIAGLIARRIVGWADKGAKLEKGERFGMIRFGSRVEIFLPPGTEVTVKVGDSAKGGETILARRP
jgi:phosphatidylserine decarboxylase